MALTDLDRKFDAVLAAVTGPGGRVILDRDDEGRAIVGNFPATLPLFFKTFCMLNADVEAVIAGNERLTFARLDALSDRLAHGLGARGIVRVTGSDRHAQLPRLGPVLHGGGQGRSVARCSRLVAIGKLEHALS